MKRLALCLLTFVLAFALTFALVSCTTDNGKVDDEKNNNNENVNNQNSNNDDPIHAHAFDRAVVDDDYFKAGPTCSAGALYYYSCECGVKGKDTFEHGPHAHSYDFEANKCSKCGGNALVYDETNAVVGVYDSYVDHIIIPDYVIVDSARGTKAAVTSIEKSAFSNLPELVTVEIGNNVKTIGKDAFRGCENLEEVTFGSALTYVYPDAFYECTSVKAVHGASLRDWLEIEFVNCASNPMHLSAQLSFGDDLFTELDLAKSGIYVEKINNHAFYGCSSLETVKINGTVNTIGDYAFSNCASLSSLDLSTSVDNYGHKAFEACPSFKKINIHDLSDWCDISFGAPDSNPIFYGGNLYVNDITVEYLTIPNDVSVILPYAFYGCSNVKTLSIPESSVSSISASAFHNCYNLEFVLLSEGVSEIGNSAFSHCKSLKTILIPTTLEGINYDAFLECSSLSDVHIPNIFTWCKIVFDNAVANPTYATGANLFIDGQLVTDLIIPDSVTRINHYAFYNCTMIDSITIGANVTYIGEYAFYNCTNVSRLYYNAVCVNDLYMDNYAFAGFGADTKGVSVMVGKDVVSLPDYLFMPVLNGENTANVTSLDFESGSVCNSIGNYLLANSSSLNSVTIPTSVDVIGNHAFYKCEKLMNLEMKYGVCDPHTVIEDYAFAYCVSLTNLNVSSCVISIGSFAFTESGLSTVTLSHGLESIGYKAFYGCENLKTVYNYSHLDLPKYSTSNGYITYYFDKK